MYTHSLFPYPAKFPAEPIREFIKKFTKAGDNVLDPFCGSGTVLVESLLNGRNATGIDLNPLSTQISYAKSRNYRKRDLNKVKSIIEQLGSIQDKPTEWFEEKLNTSQVQDYDNIDHWFEHSMKIELSYVKNFLLDHISLQSNSSALLWMAFLHIIIPVSKQDSDSRYTAVKKHEHVPGFAIKKILDVLTNYVTVIYNFHKSGNRLVQSDIRVIEGDCVEELDGLSANSFDLAITSPPYINTFDYYLYHKHRIFWMDKRPQDVRRREVGCHHRVDTMSFEKALSDYSNDIEIVLEKVHKSLKDGGRFVWLIGDGIVKGELVSANSLIKELAIRTNYKFESIESRNIREVSKGFIKGKNIDKKKHHVIVLQKT